MKDGLRFFPNYFQNFPITTPRYKHPRVKSGCKIKIVLHIKGATKTANKSRGLCLLRTNFFSSLYPNFDDKHHFPSFFIYPLHLNILSQIKETKKRKSRAQYVRLVAYVHIELNLIPTLVTLVLIIITIFLFVVSNEISVTMKQNYIWHQFLENSYAVFTLQSQINWYKLTVQIILF